MKRFYFLIALCLAPLSPTFSADPKETIQDSIVECETLEDIEQAKKQGAMFIKKGNYYFVNVGGEYKGPYQNLDTAKNLRVRYLEEAQKKGIVISDSKHSGAYHPRLMIDPFTRFNDKNELEFRVPGDTWVKPAVVMIHPEPLVFDEVSFGKIELPKKGMFFAVTGKILTQETIRFDPNRLEMNIGASVIGSDGNVLWQTYGRLENDRGFKCMASFTPTTIKPAYLLLFSIGKGKMDTMLTSQKNIPTQDAAPFDYHILCSAALEVGPDWFPPLEQATEEEYNKMLDELSRKKIEKIKQFGIPPR